MQGTPSFIKMFLCLSWNHDGIEKWGAYKVVSENMLSEIMDRLNLWHYEDADDRREQDFWK